MPKEQLARLVDKAQALVLNGLILGGPPVQAPDLHHYTTPHGLLGILESNSLWASAAQYSNDLAETRYAYLLARETLSAVAEEWSRRSALHRECFAFLHEFFSDAERPIYDAYMVSFCERGDLLSQWRAYGQGVGFALTFHGLTKYRMPPSAPSGTNEVQLQCKCATNILLRKVIYVREEQRFIFLRWLQAASNGIDILLDFKATSDEPSEPLREAASIVMAICVYRLLEWIYSIKDAVFEEEQEWRLICIPDPRDGCRHPDYKSFEDWKVRVLRRLLVPYVILRPPSGILPLSAITCGPGSHAFLSKRALEMLLKSNGYASTTVHMSSVPLRID